MREIFTKHRWLLHIAGVALGIGIGFFAGREDAKPTSPAAADELARTSSLRSASSAHVSDEEKGKATRLAQIRDKAMSADYGEREEFAESVRAEDVPDLLTVFQEDAGLDGIEYWQEDILEKAVALWMAEDSDGALLWAANLSPPALRRNLQGMMLGMLAKTEHFVR